MGLSRLFVLASAAFLVPAMLAGGSALAGVPAPADPSGCWPGSLPCPPLCRFELSDPAESCQYRFVADGSGDALTLRVTLRNGLGQPIVDCLTTVRLVPTPGTETVFCACCPVAQAAVTDGGGAFEVSWTSIGGHGSLDVAVTTRRSGDIALFGESVAFTSTDLDGSCELAAATGS